MNAASDPKTLIEAITYFADEDKAVAFAVAKRWPEGVTCPFCGERDVAEIPNRRTWRCRDCSKQFSVKVGTVMEDSPIPVSKWLVVMWLAANAKNSISSYEVHRAIGVTQKSAWFMMHRVHVAMQGDDDGSVFSGEVEADETFVGGKRQNMHKSKRPTQGTGGQGKTIVMGILERKGRVRAKVIPNIKKGTLQNEVRENVAAGSEVFTDACASYAGLGEDYVHAVVDHAVKYVEGKIHTNGLENFWSLFKRCIKGTHISIEPFHLSKYVDAEAFRFNNRKTNDGERLVRVIKGMSGKRLTYKQLTTEHSDFPPRP